MSSLQLSEAQVERRQRAEALVRTRISDTAEALCDLVQDHARESLAGTSAIKNYQLVGPAARQKLKGLIDFYRKKPHPFTSCVHDNTKRFGEEGAKKVCAVLTDLEKGTTKWRNGGNHSALSEAFADQPAIDEELFGLLTAMVDTPYRALLGLEPRVEDDGVDLAMLNAKKRASLPPQSFVFSGQRKYPIHDRTHAANAMARSKGKPEESAVRTAVCKRFSDLPGCQPQSQKKTNAAESEQGDGVALAAAASQAQFLKRKTTHGAAARRSVLDKAGNRDYIRGLVNSVLDDINGDADGDLKGSNPDAQIAAKLRALEAIFMGDKNANLGSGGTS